LLLYLAYRQFRLYCTVEITVPSYSYEMPFDIVVYKQVTQVINVRTISLQNSEQLLRKCKKTRGYFLSQPVRFHQEIYDECIKFV